MRTVAIANQKGGCGKTITAINLSACLGVKRKNVLLIDLDPQGHSTIGLGVKGDEREKVAQFRKDRENAIADLQDDFSEKAKLLAFALYKLSLPTNLSGRDRTQTISLHITMKDRIMITRIKTHPYNLCILDN